MHTKLDKKFTYVVISKEKFDTMLSIEEGWHKTRPMFEKWEAKLVCDSKEQTPRPEYYNSYRYNPDSTQMEGDEKLRFVHSTSELESGKEYDIIIFPKTCSAGFCFVKTQEDPKQ